MPIPATHKARVRVQYGADDGSIHSVFIPASWHAAGFALSMGLVADNQVSTHPPLPANIKPRHLYIETTDGEDVDGKYHVFRRTVPFADTDVAPGATLAIGTAFSFEGCNWVVKGRVGEKRVDR